MKKTQSPFLKNIIPIVHLKYNPYSNPNQHSKSYNNKRLNQQ